MSPRVLIVDDNPVNLKLASDVLACEGFTVCGAANADEAMLAIRSRLPDLVLMDVALPGMDGLTLTRLLRSDPATHDLRIVALTAFAMKGDARRTIEAGCDGYISKPIDTRTFARQVAQWLPPQAAAPSSGRPPDHRRDTP